MCQTSERKSGLPAEHAEVGRGEREREKEEKDDGDDDTEDERGADAGAS